ncbi:MAG TPA: cytochrome C oxidase subunit IV family protein [Bryobacteraceae bacterium]|jgi:cytochrome c oxidase subunit 4|nr:cytochrome C oxidase subunit IV family protein [Bryobacteraceae bacterium]
MADHGSKTAEHHVVPKRVYFLVFFTLIVLTWVTTYVATLDLGRWNIFVALAIAIFKASIVALFFMHVFYSTRLTKMIVVAAIFWLILLLFITMADLWTRGWMGVPGR